MFPEKTIYLITDGTITPENFTEKKNGLRRLLQTAVAHKINLIQLREKQIPARLVFELTAEAVKIAQNTATRILVNERADIALAAGAAGVQLTAQAIPADVVRRSFPKDFIIGVSTHTLAEAEAARRHKADFAVFGPVFATPSKTAWGEPQGLEKLGRVCSELSPFPVIAVGGIDETNYPQVFAAGARGFAAIRFLNDAQNFMNGKW